MPRPLSRTHFASKVDELFAGDLARNLPPAKLLGLTTLWIDNGSEQVGEDSAHAIDYRTADLGLWLDDIMGTE